MDILSPGEKIKYYRILYKLKQKEICKDIITPAMLSYIENEKYQLSEEIAEKLTTRINLLVNDSSRRITTESILASEESQLDNYLYQVKLNIKYISTKSIKELYSIFNQFPNINKKIKIITAILSFSINKKIKLDYEKLLLENINDILENQLFSLLPINLLLIQRINIDKGDYKKNIELYYSLKKLLKGKNEIIGHVFFNFALSFQKENVPKTSIFLYNKALCFFRKEEKITNCLINTSICHSLAGSYEKELEIIKTLDTFNLSLHKRIVNMGNLLSCYINLENELGVKISLNKLESAIATVSNLECLYQSFYCLGKGYIYLNDRLNAMKNFEKELGLPFNSTNPQFFIVKIKEIILELIKIYHPSEIKKFKNLEKYIIMIPHESLDVGFVLSLSKKYCEVYSKQDTIRLLQTLQTQKDKN